MSPQRRTNDADADAVIRRGERLLLSAPARTLPVTEYAELLRRYRLLLSKFNKVMVISDSYSAELKSVTEQLDALRSLALPICMYCKKIRADDGYWEQIEKYFSSHIDVAFTHGICPTCMEERYGQLMDTPKAREQIVQDVRARAQREAGGIPDEDAAVREAQALLDAGGDAGGEPGTARTGLRKLVERYRRLLRRMGKILLISDGYQARLMDLNGRLQVLAHTDGLTGLGNRHDAIERLEAERSRAERHGGTFSLAVADVDDFKAVNDTHGHEAGDMLLRELGRVLRADLRREDTCARWGGEEFLVLLPETGAEAAEALVKKLLAAARAVQVPYQGTTLRCTLSAGCATFAPGRTVDDLLREADARMYLAKRQGKDRLSTDGPPR